MLDGEYLLTSVVTYLCILLHISYLSRCTLYLYFIWHSTHVLQDETSTVYLILRALTPGSLYKFCVIPSDEACAGRTWSCITRVVPHLLTTKHTGDVHRPNNTVRYLRIVGSGANSLQVSWMPQRHTIQSVAVHPPRSYVIAVMPETKDSQTACLVHIYYLQAPWSKKADHELRTQAVGYVQNKSLNQLQCNVKAHSKLHHVYPLGVWPDWESYEELLDEWGPVGDFTVSLTDLIPNHTYGLHLWPVSAHDPNSCQVLTARTTTIENDCNLKLVKATQRESHITWSLPEILFKGLLEQMELNNSLSFFVELERIGRPPLEGLRDSCFVQGCDTVYDAPQFRPQSIGEPQRVLCLSADAPFDMSNREQSFSASCLLPCQVYQLTVSVRVNSVLRSDLFSCQRRVIREGQAAQPSADSFAATALSHELLVLRISEQQLSTHDYCAPVGYAIDLLYRNMQTSVEPMLFTMDDLRRGWQLPVRSVGDTDSYQLVLRHSPGLLSGELQLIPISHSTNAQDQLTKTATVAFRNQPDACKMDCLWTHSTSAEDIYESVGVYVTGQIFGFHEATRVPCERSTVVSGRKRTLCQTTSGILHSDQAVCELDRGWGICDVPRCNDVAPLQCVTNVHVSVANTTELQLRWTPPAQANLGSVKLAKPFGLVTTLSEPARWRAHAPKCIQSGLWLGKTSRRWTTGKQTRLINTVLHSCPLVNRSLLVSNEDMTFWFKNLRQNASFELRVTAFDETGRLGASWIQTINTEPAAPCRPIGVNVTRVESRALTLSWLVPTSGDCGPPTEVLIHYYPEYVEPHEAIAPKPLKLPLSMTPRLADLLPCQTYCIQVQLINDVRAGPISDKLCHRTKRQERDCNYTILSFLAFTRPPTMAFLLSIPQSSEFKPSHNRFQHLQPEEFVVCNLQVHLDYPKTCPVHYQIQYTVYNSMQTHSIFFDQNVKLIVLLLTCFLLNAAPFKLKNLSIHVQPSTTAGTVPVCVQQTSVRESTNSNQPAPRMIEARPNDLCFHVHWDIDGGTRGLIGFAVLLFGDADPTNNPRSDVSEIDTASKKSSHCLRWIWVPCDKCLGEYSLKNAHERVWKSLIEFIRQCDNQNDFRSSVLNMYEQTPVMDRFAAILRQIALPSLFPNEASVNFLLNASQIVAIPPSIHSEDGLHRTLRSVSNNGVEMIGYGLHHTKVQQGLMKIYTVSANNVTLTTEQPWNIYIPPSEWGEIPGTAVVGLVLGVLFVILLLTLLCLLVVFNAKRRRRKRHSALQRVEEFDSPETVGENGYLRLKVKQPIIPPRIGNFLLRQPDPISVHDFVIWFNKQSYNNFESLREEFKCLRIHSVRQGQAKRFTCNVGQRPENRLRNKYRNLVP
ncbi:uncharacterized protein DEA37_0002942, partial [Paragonimus westermani]